MKKLRSRYFSSSAVGSPRRPPRAPVLERASGCTSSVGPAPASSSPRSRFSRARASKRSASVLGRVDGAGSACASATSSSSSSPARCMATRRPEGLLRRGAPLALTSGAAAASAPSSAARRRLWRVTLGLTSKLFPPWTMSRYESRALKLRSAYSAFVCAFASSDWRSAKSGCSGMFSKRRSLSSRDSRTAAPVAFFFVRWYLPWARSTTLNRFSRSVLLVTICLR
mmetsp:Transcript_34935/g.107834  ORF Transcript_34935/g.107834 Transcript_34935/m.107834 type:complete len:226 (-) Transcript_34935:1333-2010(-)